MGLAQTDRTGASSGLARSARPPDGLQCITKLMKCSRLTPKATYDTLDDMATINIRTVPDDLHRKFKIFAVTKGSTLKAEILRLMQV